MYAILKDMHLLWLAASSLAATPMTVTLDGGALLTVLARPSAADVALSDWISVGAADDPPDLPGAAHLLEHVVVDTSSDDGLESRLAAWGGTANAFTGIDYTRYTARLPAAALPDALAALAARTQELSVSPDAIAREQRVVREELSQRPWGLLDRISALVDAHLWGEHPYARADAGRVSTLAGAAPEQLQPLLDAGYAPPNHHLIVVGPVEPEAVIAQAQAAFPARTAPPHPAVPEIVLSALPEAVEDTAQTPLYRAGGVVWPLPPASSEDYWPLRLALDLLESDSARALALLPPESRALRVGVEVTWGRAGGRLLVVALHPSLRDPDRVAADSAAFGAAVVETGWLDDATLATALRSRERELLSAAWDVLETAGWLGRSARLRGVPRAPEEIAASLRRLTAADIRAAWQRWIHTQAMIPVLVNVG